MTSRAPDSSLSAAHLKRLLAEGNGVHLLNVLPRRSFEKAHIPGSTSLSFYDDEFVERVAAHVGDRDATIVVYCLTASCNASTRAARQLTDAGFTRVLDFEGGLREWEQAGYPVQQGSGQQSP